VLLIEVDLRPFFCLEYFKSTGNALYPVIVSNLSYPQLAPLRVFQKAVNEHRVLTIWPLPAGITKEVL
jgi:hypothetical protein